MAEQIPQIPEIPLDPTEVNLKETVTREVTLNDLPPPGAIFQRKLTDRELIALKGFGADSLKFLNEMSKDMLPGIGEARAVEYTNQEIEGLKKAVQEKDVPGTIVHGIGVPLMSAGTLPYWLGGGVIGGAAAFLMRDIIGKGYRRLTQKYRTEPVRGAQPPQDIDSSIFEVKGNKQAQKRSDLTINKQNVPIKITEKYNFGESATPVRTGYSTLTKDFQGSRAFDVIAQENMKGMTPEQMTNRLINLMRTGKVSREELFDAGILKVDENFKPVGGALVKNLPKELKGAVITKQDILKMLRDAPASRLKISRYGGETRLDSGFYDLYASTDIMAANLMGNIDELIFNTTNTAARRDLRDLRQLIDGNREKYDRVINNTSLAGNVSNFAPQKTIAQIRDRLPLLDPGSQQILRAYLGNIEKMRKYVSPQKFSDFKGPGKHSSVSTEGGDNYYETVISLDETIPLNREGKKVFSSHFPDANPIVHYRAKTRYKQNGDPVISIEEIQSDTIQPFYDSGKKALREAVENPYAKNFVEAIIKKRLLTLVNDQQPLLNIQKQRSLTDRELKQLTDIDQEQRMLKKYFQRSELISDDDMKKVARVIEQGQADFFPFIKSYYKLALKSAINDAVMTGKKGVTIVPVGKGTHHSKDTGHYLYYGDNKGSKVKGLETKALPRPGKKKKGQALAIYPATLKQIAKELKQDYGIDFKLGTQKIYNTPLPTSGKYLLRAPNGSIVAQFKSKQNRDYVLQKANARRSSSDMLQADILDDATLQVDEAFTGFTLEIPDNAAKILRKKKMRSYKTGGLVAIEPKREYFAPIF